MMTETFDHLAALNKEQLKAVENTEGPLLVLAGAGTGKTRVLIARLVNILRQNKAYPSQILAVTFTNKAALEMKERTTSLLGRSLEGLWLGTFHSIGVRILRRHAEVLGFTSNFTILDTDDQERIIKQLLQLEGLDDKKQTSRIFVSIISGWKDRGLTPDKITDDYLGWDKSHQALHLYRLYQERLKFLNAMDFGDLLLHCLSLFTAYPEVLKTYTDRFKYILVDEYQDTNVAQYLWLRLLAQGSQNICCVGDDDQSIYGWRGAEVGNILRFEKDFPGAKIVRLEQNYRSSPAILAAASQLIANNKSRLGKTLWTEQDSGDPVFIKSVWDSLEESRWIGGEIENAHRKGVPLSEMSILVRAGFQTREFEETFMSMAIPYRIVGGLRFYERQEIRDALAYLRLAAQPKNDLAFERILNVPRRGIGKTTLQKMHMVARAQNQSLFEVAKSLVETDEVRDKTRTALRKFIQDMERWHNLVPHTPQDELTKIILDESGYTWMWKQEKTPDAEGRLENLKELVTAIAEFPSLAEFLDHVSLVMENTENASENAVTLMTMHAAKGLEFSVVFLTGWEEGIFPSQRTLMEGTEKEIEEERRLAYVALTRAKKNAYITFASNRRVHGQWQHNLPSRFIQELPPEHICFLDKTILRQPMMRVKESLRIPDTATLYPKGKYKPGDRVFHLKFGYGTVQIVESDRLTIHFDHAGVKKVLESFIQSA
jgi:DNA helicase II / ATP-dependent DNA helicase PcrA